MKIANAILCLAYTIALLTSCSFKKDEDKNTPKENAPPNVIETIQKEQEKQAFEGQLTASNVVVTFLEQPEPRSYVMKITWPEQIKRMQVIVNNKTPVIHISSNNTGSSHEELVLSEREQDIELLAYDSLGAPISSLALKKVAPLDYVLGANLNLNKDTVINVNRFFILPSAQLTTNGYNLSITTNKLIITPPSEETKVSDRLGLISKSHILTNLPGAVAENEHLLKGSNISIQAKQATGHLIVSLIGYNGKDGQNGESLERLLGISKNRNTALDGVSGEAGVVKSQSIPCTQRRNVDGPPCEREVLLCEKSPTNGTDGQPGPRGYAGENGANGGNTGSVSVIAEEKSQFSLEVIQKAGQAGKGGIGATGFLGGLGGKAGTNPGGPCTSAKDGQPGPKGANGDNGLDGSPGKIGDVITNIQNIKIIQL